MALEDIFRALEEQADKDIEAVLAEAKDHAQVILEDARREAQQAKEAQIAEAEERARMRSVQSLNTVRLEVRKQVASAKERAVASVFQKAHESLGEVRGKKDYAALLKALVEEAVSGVPEGFELLVDPADVELAKTVLAELGSKATVSADLKTSGGVVVAIDGRRILRRNTLEDRLEKFEGAAQAEVAEILFA